MGHSLVMARKPDFRHLEALRVHLEHVNEHGSVQLKHWLETLFVHGQLVHVTNASVIYGRDLGTDQIETLAPTEPDDPSFLTAIIGMANRVGASRVRRCPLPECEKFFVATHGRQKFCSPSHAAKAAYRAYQQRKEGVRHGDQEDW
jgi:hypothetical protein